MDTVFIDGVRTKDHRRRNFVVYVEKLL